MTSRPADAIRQFIRRRHDLRPMCYLAGIAEIFLRLYYNEDFYAFHSNGEQFALQTFATWIGTRRFTVWDVGANEGEWAQLAHRFLPTASIHCFEILPPIAQTCARRVGDEPWATLHVMGMSEKEGEAQVTWNKDCEVTSSIAMRRTGVPGADMEVLTCQISTADTQISKGVPPPLLLKIDTEGHDASVLRGARELLNGDNAPAMIQFEYGETWLPGRETLERTQALLEEAGYRVGRLYPNHVAFKSYEYRDDHFRMGNMIAAKPADLIALLSRAA